jgi:hypothetical protein
MSLKFVGVASYHAVHDSFTRCKTLHVASGFISDPKESVLRTFIAIASAGFEPTSRLYH